MTRVGGWEPTGFGQALRREREKAGLTQLQLADKAGCAKSAVSKLETGDHEPAWPLVLAFARALGVGVGVFVPEEGDGTETKREEGEGASVEKRPRGRPKKATTQGATGVQEGKDGR